MKYLENKRLKYPHNHVIITNDLKFVRIDNKYVYDRIGKDNHYIIKIEHLNKVENIWTPRRKKKTLRKFIDSSRYERYCSGIKMTYTQCKEVKSVLNSMNVYNEKFFMECLYGLIAHGVNTRFLDRMRMLNNLKSSDTMAGKIINYGISEGLRLYDIKCNNYSGENNPGYQHNGKFSPYSKKFIKYDDVDDVESIRKEVFKKARKTCQDNNNDNTQLSYYLARGYDDVEARKMLNKRQTTFSKKRCIERHGEEKGLRVWQERQDKWQDTLTSKSQEEIDDINRRKFSGGGHSKISQELFNKLGYDSARYGTNYGEYRVKLKSGKHCSFDYFFNGKVIEFNGDVWHANPLKFKPMDHPLINHFNSSITSKEIWDRDAQRLNDIRELGYEVLIIWEYDYKNDPIGVIDKCRKFINMEVLNEDYIEYQK